jgi:5'-nucleotidase
MGNLVTDAMLYKVNSSSSGSLQLNSPNAAPYQIAIQNGGGLRAGIEAGSISVGEIVEVLPFGNTIATFEITGTHIITALENGVSRVGGTSGTGRFPQVSGLRYSFDPGQEPGSRITSVEVLSGTQYVALDENAIYRVVTNNFVREGGDGYEVFADYAIDPYDEGPALDEALMDYITEFSPITPVLEGRISSSVTYEIFLPVFLNQ